MYIAEIRLVNFRNHKDKTVSFENKLNIISGKNGVGKTNILEAIYFSAFAKSFKTAKDKEMINYNSDLLRCIILFEKNKRQQSIEIAFLANGKKQIKINKVSISNMSELIGKLNIVFFAPEDLKIITGSPLERRRFLDREISQIYSSYYKDLINYGKVLAQRNNQIKLYNKTGKDKELVKIWNEGLIEYGYNVALKRESFIQAICDVSANYHQKISSNNEKLEIFYKANIGLANNFKNEYKKILEKSFNNDLHYGYTTRGIHKDDFEVLVNEMPVKVFGSQGQKRTSALSIKLSQLNVMEKIIGEKPILLLDDVSSELDNIRRNILIDIIKDNQSIMTTTDIKDFKEKEYTYKNIFL